MVEDLPKETALRDDSPVDLRATRFAAGLAVFVMFMASTLLTPMYALYRDAYQLGAFEITLVYAVYVIGNLTALLFLGRLSDQFGRRPITLAGLGLSALSAVLFMLATGPIWLFAGRIVNGLAVGVGSAAATAWLVDASLPQRKHLAASTMTAANFAGLTAGPICAGLLVQYAPSPMQLPFAAYLALLITTFMLVRVAFEPAATGARGRLTLKPRLGVPAGLRVMFAAPAIAGFTSMSVVGYYAALGPAMIRSELRITNHALSGLVVAELFAIATLTIIATRAIPARRTLMLGLLGIPIGLGAMLFAQSHSSLSWLMLATTLIGTACALGFRGGLAVINAMAPLDGRAEMASSYFICCFIGNALPIIGVGALSESVGLTWASRAFALSLALLALLAFVILLSTRACATCAASRL